MFRQDCILECCAEMELFKVLLPLHGKVVWQVMGIQCSGTDEQPMSMEILNHQSHCPAQGIYAVHFCSMMGEIQKTKTNACILCSITRNYS